MHELTPRTTHKRHISLFLALLIGLTFSVSAGAQEEATADWSGAWDTLWRDGGARLTLEQDGATVTGTYPLYPVGSRPRR